MALYVEGVKRAKTEVTGEAFDHLFVSEYRRVVAIAYRVLGDADEAEDVAQDAFVSFHRRHDAGAPFAAAWLHRAASHLALNAVRARKRRSWRETEDAAANARAGQPRSAILDPSENAELAEQRVLVRRALERLPKRSAAVLALRYSGLSYAEVASAMGCGVGQVGTLLRRAEAAFRKEMDHESH
jgi:RNA polymerase sigma-70 factor (ECF subfamily)